MATKNIKREALGILREFEIAGKLSTAGDIFSCKELSPRPSTRLLLTVFGTTQYAIVINNTADDDIEILEDIIKSVFPALHGHFLRNPAETSFETYGIRHKFRDTYVFEVEPVMVRLDKELATRYPDISRATIQKYIKAGYVTVAGEVIKKPKTEVTPTTAIALRPPAPEDFSHHELPIVYIDDDVVVIDKPAGILTHSKGVMSTEFTVADFFRRYTTYGLATNRPGIVHRLDRDTSGLLIGARTDEAAHLLKKQFSDRTVKKTYFALTDGSPKNSRALIDLPIGRSPSAPSTFRVDPKGKPAITSYDVLKTSPRYSLVELRPKTGRTHQLRVHMQYVGSPIHGDRIYSNLAKSSKAANTGSLAKRAPRLYLHAAKLEITLPHGKRHVFESALPQEFEQVFAGDLGE